MNSYYISKEFVVQYSFEKWSSRGTKHKNEAGAVYVFYQKQNDAFNYLTIFNIWGQKYFFWISIVKNQILSFEFPFIWWSFDKV